MYIPVYNNIQTTKCIFGQRRRLPTRTRLNTFALKCIIYRGIKTRPEPDQLYTFRNNLIAYYYMAYIVIICVLCIPIRYLRIQI